MTQGDESSSPRELIPGNEQLHMRMHCLRHGIVLDERAEAEDEAALDDFLAERSDDWDPARSPLPHDDPSAHDLDEAVELPGPIPARGSLPLSE